MDLVSLLDLQVLQNQCNESDEDENDIGESFNGGLHLDETQLKGDLSRTSFFYVCQLHGG